MFRSVRHARYDSVDFVALGADDHAAYGRRASGFDMKAARDRDECPWSRVMALQGQHAAGIAIAACQEGGFLFARCHRCLSVAGARAGGNEKARSCDRADPERPRMLSRRILVRAPR